jgi:hypothetical protein
VAGCLTADRTEQTTEKQEISRFHTGGNFMVNQMSRCEFLGFRSVGCSSGKRCWRKYSGLIYKVLNVQDIWTFPHFYQYTLLKSREPCTQSGSFISQKNRILKQWRNYVFWRPGASSHNGRP